MRRFVVGDIHGRYDALIACLKAVEFDKDKDKLITLGDLGDYHDGFCDVVELLISIGGINILGNHDMIFKYWIHCGTHLWNWSHGGDGMLASYSKYLNREFNFYDKMLKRADIPVHHKEFIWSLKEYHLTDDGILFCHAGFNPEWRLEDNSGDHFFNDRKLYQAAKKGTMDLLNHTNINKIFVGHTCTGDKPFISDKLINLDTGAKHDDGHLTIMNVDTLEYHSEKV